MTHDTSTLPADRPRRSYVIVFSGFTGQILLQFALQLLLARLFGASRGMDAYGAAMALPVSLSAVLAGTLGTVLIASFGSERSHSLQASLAGATLFGTLILSLVLSACGMAFSREIMSALHPHFDPLKVDQSADLFRILIWLFPANALIGLLQCVLNARLNFVVPTVAGALGPLLTVLLVWEFGAASGLEAVAWATLGGAVLNVLIQIPSAAESLSLSGWKSTLSRVRSLARLALPILLGTLILKIDPLVDRYASSDLEDGSIAQLGYAMRIVTIFVMFAGGVLSTVSFPRIARKAGTGAGAEPLVNEFSRALRTLVTLVLPAVVVLLLFSRPLVRDLLERGEFTAADTAIVARMLSAYAGMLFGAALGEICVKTMYVLRDSLTPMLVGGAALIAGFVLKLWLVPRYGVVVLALITSAVYVSGGAVNLAVLVRKVGKQVFAGLGRHALRCGFASAAAAGIGSAVLQFEFPFNSVAGLLLGAVVYFALLGSLDADTRSLARQLLARVTGRTEGGGGTEAQQSEEASADNK